MGTVWIPIEDGGSMEVPDTDPRAQQYRHWLSHLNTPQFKVRKLGSARTMHDGVYVVRMGDTLSEIARDLCGDWRLYASIAKLNTIADPNRIYAGQLLKIPTSQSPTPPQTGGPASKPSMPWQSGNSAPTPDLSAFFADPYPQKAPSSSSPRSPNVAGSSFTDRLGEVLVRSLPKLGPDVGAELAGFFTAESIAIMAVVLVAWIVGHAFGYGEAIDAVLAVVGVLSIGMPIFTGLDELYMFGSKTYNATSEADLDQAADHFAKAIAILGVQAALSLLFKGKARPRGKRVTLPRGPGSLGARYYPSLKFDASMKAGAGKTTFWGDITVASSGLPRDQRLALLHEQVHQFLAPKFYVLRQFRVENRVGSYFESSLYRYIEEAVAESNAQIGVNGFGGVIEGIRFPVRQRYVYFARGGGYATEMRGMGLIPEAAGLVGSGIQAGYGYEVWEQNYIDPSPPYDIHWPP